jgi:hypothetical protein
MRSIATLLCLPSKRRRSPIHIAHDIIAEKRYVMLDFSQKNLKGISGINYSTRFGILVDNRNMHKATLFHFQQDIKQHVGRMAKGHISAHNGSNRCHAAVSLTICNLSNDIRLGYDAHHSSVDVAHNHKAYVRL